MRDDVEFNVSLCKLVEKYPQLYDGRKGNIRNLKNRIWEEIGRRLNGSAYDCKQSWRQIRGRYWDYLAIQGRQSSFPTEKRFVLTYCLAPHLKFLDPYFLPRRALKRVVEAPPLKESPKKIKKKEILIKAIPDMKGLSRTQNEKFKFGVVTLIERILQQGKVKDLLTKSLTD